VTALDQSKFRSQNEHSYTTDTRSISAMSSYDSLNPTTHPNYQAACRWLSYIQNYYSPSKAKNLWPWQRSLAPVDSHVTHDSMGQFEPTTQQCLDRFSRFCTDYRVSLYFTIGLPIPPKIAPSHGGYGPHLTRSSLGPPESSNETVFRSVQPFLQGLLV